MPAVPYKVFQARLKERSKLPPESKPAEPQAPDARIPQALAAAAAAETVSLKAHQRSHEAAGIAAEASGKATKATSMALSVKSQLSAVSQQIDGVRSLATVAKERAESVEPRFREIAAEHQQDRQQLAALSEQVKQAIAGAGSNKVVDVQPDATGISIVFSDGTKREIKWPKAKSPKLMGGSGPSFIREIQWRSIVVTADNANLSPDFDVFLVDATAGDLDVFLPPSRPGTRRRIEVKKINTTGGDVYIKPAVGSTDQVEYNTDVKLCGDCRPSVSMVEIVGGWVYV